MGPDGNSAAPMDDYQGTDQARISRTISVDLMDGHGSRGDVAPPGLGVAALVGRAPAEPSPDVGREVSVA